MKNIIYYLAFLLLLSNFLNAQTKKGLYKKEDLTTIFISEDLSIHFRSPEPIQYVDISSNKIIGDLPVENILSIKYMPDSLSLNNKHFYNDEDLAVVTIVGQSFMAQYNITYMDYNRNSNLISQVEILPEVMTPLEFPEVGLTKNEMKRISYELIRKNPTWKNVKAKGLGLEAKLNNLYSFGDYVFIDLSFDNTTNIKYDLDEIRFKIEDKNVLKATNHQDIEIKPEFVLNHVKEFKRSYRNIFVFRKFTFPNSKILNVQISERTLNSGRTLDLKIDYKDLLNADSF